MLKAFIPRDAGQLASPVVEFIEKPTSNVLQWALKKKWDGDDPRGFHEAPRLQYLSEYPWRWIVIKYGLVTIRCLTLRQFCLVSNSMVGYIIEWWSVDTFVQELEHGNREMGLDPNKVFYKGYAYISWENTIYSCTLMALHQTSSVCVCLSLGGLHIQNLSNGYRTTRDETKCNVS